MTTWSPSNPDLESDHDKPTHAICRPCGGSITWIDCPHAGGWWAHNVHPTDGHDAEPPIRRQLTELEHHAAWHAIEGAAGEDGADPDTVLNAVLAALDIDAPAA